MLQQSDPARWYGRVRWKYVPDEDSRPPTPETVNLGDAEIAWIQSSRGETFGEWLALMQETGP